MKFLVSITILALASVCLAIEQQPQASATAQSSSSPTTSNNQIANKHHQAAATASDGRQGRSISSSGSSGNSLTSNSNANSNSIEINSNKSRLEAEKRQVQEFLTTRNIFKSIIKLLFGNQEEITATSRNVLGVLSKVLDLLKNTFGQKSRSGTARTIRDSAEDVANAGVSVLQGYVKSVLANDSTCAKRYLCQASHEALRDGRELGFVIASVGGYATSYLLDNSRPGNFQSYHDAAQRGRSMQTDCAKLFSECAE